MSAVAEGKTALRAALYARRAEAHGDPERDAEANRRLFASIGAASGRVVSAFRPIRSEIDPTPTMLALLETGARLCVPVIEAKGQPLKFREWRPGAAMIRGPFGAEIPEAGDWMEPDIIITPLLGWDRAGFRLGYGGGFYDRTLARLRAKGPTRAIGFAYAAQEVPRTPIDGTDERLDVIVTELEEIIITQ